MRSVNKRQRSPSKRAMRTLSLLAIVIAVTACHSTSTTSSSMSAEQACTDRVNAQCLQLESCDPASLTRLYGDVATCESRMMLSCLPALAAPSTSALPAQYEACAAALGASDCSALFMRTPPTACRATPGKLGDGAACGDDAQCAGMYCKKPPNQVCGACGTRTAIGDACQSDDECDFGLACANGGCVPLVGLGASCAAAPCAAPNFCNSAQLCEAPRSAGLPCTRTLSGGSECDVTQELYCNAQSVCAVRSFAARSACPGNRIARSPAAP